MAMFIITIGAGVYAQNSLFASKAGMVLTYANTDAKGNTGSYSVLTVKDVKGSGKNMTITYGMTALDKNRKTPKNSPGEMTYQVVIKDGVMIMDMNQMVPGDLKDQGMKIDVKGTPMELPGSLQPGQALKTSEITISMDLGIMKMDSKVKTEGKCLAIEDVKVPAGTFKCHKISQKITTTAMNTNTVQTTISWYAPNVGTVKTETYDEKNKLVSGSVLAEVKGN
jgi:hypothetical protein